MDAIASRYAQALHGLASNQEQLVTGLKQLKTLADFLNHDPSLIAFLSNAFYTREQKEALITSVFQDMSSDLFGLLIVLIRNHRTRYLPTIVSEAIRYFEHSLGIRHGVLYTAKLFSASQLELLQQQLSAHTKTEVQLTQQLDNQLLGGFLIDLDGKMYDASIAGQLNALQQHLKNRGNRHEN
jgi:F-type H+-transporting ATPase subunit delta